MLDADSKPKTAVRFCLHVWIKEFLKIKASVWNLLSRVEAHMVSCLPQFPAHELADGDDYAKVDTTHPWYNELTGALWGNELHQSHRL